MILPNHLIEKIKGQVPEDELDTFIKSLPDSLKTHLSLDDNQAIIDSILSIELLPDTIAKGRILKVTFYDFLGKEDSEKKLDKRDRSGTCRGLLYALDDGAQVLEHEHKDTGKPEDNMELYLVEEGIVKDLKGKPMQLDICFIGKKHGISSMSQGTYIQTIKVDREHMKSFFDQYRKEQKPQPGHEHGE